jgi:hypothetical protein
MGSAGCWACAPAGALILPPTTLDGPSSDIGEFGGVAAAPDGTGGLVYIKQLNETPHVFAARYVGGQWQTPIQVDWDDPYEASYPRIAAAEDGQLLVVWVTQLATVGGKIQHMLVSSTLGPGASSFQEPIVIDQDVGEGKGVSPSLAMGSNGQALVAYRAITANAEALGELGTVVPLHPGDVQADIKVARYLGQAWSSPQVVNRDPASSMRPPTAGNGPQVAIGIGGEAVVAWQEPEQSGTARIWARRIFSGSPSLGLVLPASPSTYDGQSVYGEADAFALSVSTNGLAKVVTRVEGSPGNPFGDPRLFVNTLPNGYDLEAAQFTGAAALAGGGPPPPGEAETPSVAVDDEGDYRIAFAAGGATEVMAGDSRTDTTLETPLGATASTTGPAPVTALNPEGGGVTAWPAAGAGEGVAVREDFPDGAAQAALISSAQSGPISALAIGGSETGESLIGFREGQPGAYEIAGDRVSVPPLSFLVSIPHGWVSPSEARISWSAAQDASGGVTYSLIVDGHVVQRGLHALSVLPDPRLLGSGVRHVQILATDASGQETLSSESDLEIDGSPPVAHVYRERGLTVSVRVRDAQSGAVARDTRFSFGDGTSASGRLTVSHTYRRPGSYVIAVWMRDRVGNEGVAHLRVSVR